VVGQQFVVSGAPLISGNLDPDFFDVVAAAGPRRLSAGAGHRFTHRLTPDRIPADEFTARVTGFN